MASAALPRWPAQLGLAARRGAGAAVRHGVPSPRPASALRLRHAAAPREGAPLAPAGVEDDGDDTQPQQLMRRVAEAYGVRVMPSQRRHTSTARGRGGAEGEGVAVATGGGRLGDPDGEDEDEDDEEWDDVVEELGNPWDLRPGRVGLLDDEEEAAAAASAAPQSPLDASTPSGAAAAAAASSTAPGSGMTRPTAVSPYADPTALPRLGRSRLLQLLHGEEGQALGAGGGGSGGVVLLDVREEGEAAAAAAAQAASGGGGVWGAAERDAGLPPPLRLPLSRLRREAVAAVLGAARGGGAGDAAAAVTVVVLPTGDHRAEQAAVRLTRVYGMGGVWLYDEGMAATDAAEQGRA